MLRAAMVDRYGEADLAEHFQAFDTICSATQDRQDAVVALLRERPVDLMIVIGGYNSSNTCNLARICAESRPTFHIADPDCLRLGRGDPPSARRREDGGDDAGLAARRPGRSSIGLTSGASTPDNLVGAAIRTAARRSAERLNRACFQHGSDAISTVQREKSVTATLNTTGRTIVFPSRTAFSEVYAMMPLAYRRRLLAARSRVSDAPRPQSTLAASAPGAGVPRGGRSDAFRKELGLTADQSARIDKIFQDTLPELQQEWDELDRLETKLSRLIEGNADEAVLARQIDRVETARANLNKTRSLMLMRMRRVLTPEQRSRFRTLSQRYEADARKQAPPHPARRSPSGARRRDLDRRSTRGPAGSGHAQNSDRDRTGTRS